MGTTKGKTRTDSDQIAAADSGRNSDRRNGASGPLMQDDIQARFLFTGLFSSRQTDQEFSGLSVTAAADSGPR